jgi:hypothetical protein
VSGLTIRTSHQSRPVLQWHDLSARERREFDYLDTDDARSCAEFVRYRGVVYDLAEFMAASKDGPEEFRAWDGYRSDSFFSGILIRYVDDAERVVCATYYS